MKILMVLTSHRQLGDIGKTASFSFNEFAASYYFFKDAGANITVVWSSGSTPISGPVSDAPDLQTDATRRFELDAFAQQVLDQAGMFASVSTSHFDAVSYPSRHAPLRNLADGAIAAKLIESKANEVKTAVAERHSSGVLRLAEVADISQLPNRKRVFGFASSVKASVSFIDIAPLLVDNMRVKNGGVHSKGADWLPYA